MFVCPLTFIITPLSALRDTLHLPAARTRRCTRTTPHISRLNNIVYTLLPPLPYRAQCCRTLFALTRTACPAAHLRTGSVFLPASLPICALRACLSPGSFVTPHRCLPACTADYTATRLLDVVRVLYDASQRRCAPAVDAMRFMY